MLTRSLVTRAACDVMRAYDTRFHMGDIQQLNSWHGRTIFCRFILFFACYELSVGCRTHKCIRYSQSIRSGFANIIFVAFGVLSRPFHTNYFLRNADTWGWPRIYIIWRKEFFQALNIEITRFWKENDFRRISFCIVGGYMWKINRLSFLICGTRRSNAAIHTKTKLNAMDGEGHEVTVRVRRWLEKHQVNEERRQKLSHGRARAEALFYHWN